MTFKSTGKISLLKLDAFELDIDRNLLAILENIDEALHIIEEDFYCGLIIEAQLIVTRNN